MCAKYIKFVFQNNFLYLFLSRKGKPLGGPSSFCLSAHASCPYAPHDRSPPEFCRNSCGRRASEGQDRPGAVPPLGWVARPCHRLSLLEKDAGKRASLKQGKRAPRPGSKKWTSKPTKFPDRRQKQRKIQSAKDERGALGMGRPQRGRCPSLRHHRFPSPCSSAACHCMFIHLPPSLAYCLHCPLSL